MKIPSGRRRVKMFLQRFGSKIEIYEPIESESALNHPEDNWNKIGTEYALRYFGSDIDKEKDYQSGRRVDSTPTIVFSIDTVVKNDYHILYGVENQIPDEYEVTALIDRGNHIQADSKKRQNGSLLDELV